MADRLAVLDVCLIPAGTSKDYDLQHLIHIALQLRINLGLIHLREVTQMMLSGRGRIYLYYNVLTDLLCHERNIGAAALLTVTSAV